MQFSDQDLAQIRKQGISLEKINAQIEHFKKGFPFINLHAPATIGNGILKLNDEDIEAYIQAFEQSLPTTKIEKFVPASGAASRMFKDIFSFIDKKGSVTATAELLKKYKSFAFAKELEDYIKIDGIEPDTDSVEGLLTIANYMVSEPGLNYGNLPKGIIRFHAYGDKDRTAFEEHLIEGIHYCKDKNNIVRLHFTVSPEHKDRITSHLEGVKAQYEKEFGVKFMITYSIQQPSTDTIAVDVDNVPFRDSDGSLLFRPAGHGALLENLNKLDAEIVFIKNIDNVVPDKFKKDTYTYKKALGGYLITIREKVFSALNSLENNEVDALESIKDFAKKDLGIPLNDNCTAQDLIEALNRPIRVCGMVKNIGEPGGGPFWIKDSTGNYSLQVIESSQVHMSDPAQKQLFETASHFNPVDLVCSITNYQHKRFNLFEFVDPSTGFISMKSKDGKDLKAQELPGLWNGSMANWITLFVEVPISTFNPVKTVADLLRPEHQ